MAISRRYECMLLYECTLANAGCLTCAPDQVHAELHSAVQQMHDLGATQGAKLNALDSKCMDLQSVVQRVTASIRQLEEEDQLSTMRDATMRRLERRLATLEARSTELMAMRSEKHEQTALQRDDVPNARMAGKTSVMSDLDDRVDSNETSVQDRDLLSFNSALDEKTDSAFPRNLAAAAVRMLPLHDMHTLCRLPSHYY